MTYRLLDTFRELFEGHLFRHRSSNQGDTVAIQLYEDIYDLKRSPKYVGRTDAEIAVLNVRNTRHGVVARRGDGSFGEIIPHVAAVAFPGFQVKRGPIATIEIGIEVKIVQKAMIRQIGRVISDLKDQVVNFRSKRGSPITVGVVGINYAQHYTSYEGEKEWRTTGVGRHRHPNQEAEETAERLLRQAAPVFDEFLILRFIATNAPPFEFHWVDEAATLMDYGSVLVRLSDSYERQR